MGVPFVYPLFLTLLLAIMVFALVRTTRPRTPLVWIAVASGVWFAALMFMTVRPGTRLGVRLNLVPVEVDSAGAALDAVKNVFVFLPIGMLLALIGWRLLATLGAALAVSLTIEVTQYVTNWGRTADINDVLTNVAGAALGWALVCAVRRGLARRRSLAPVEAPPSVY